MPKPFRDRFNLIAGTELEIEATSEGLTLRKFRKKSPLARKKGVLVHHGGTRATLDISEFIRAEREARSRLIASKNPD